MELPKEIKPVDEKQSVWEISPDYKKGMLVPSRIYASKKLLSEMDKGVFEQVTNVACLPGIQRYALCMPDGHWGYGFPIGGVAAFNPEENGVISPGGIGFDINCGMRILKTDFTIKDVKPKIKELVDTLFKMVPAGVGCRGFVKMNHQQFDEVMIDGAKWCTEHGYGWQQDLERIEDYGTLKGANPEKVSDKARSRGVDQLGTLGSGNHYLEVQVAHAENIFDEETAKKVGIVDKDQVVVMLHCLPGDSKVLTEYGYTIPIEKLEDKWRNINVKCMNINKHYLEDTNIIKFFKLKPCGKLFKIKTKTGKEIVATEEHPVLTFDGLKPIKDVVPAEKVAVLSYGGVEYEEPSNNVIVSEQDIRRIGGTERTIKNLIKKDLLPLRLNSKKLPILVKLLGFLTGDGWLGKNKDRWQVKFIGRTEDLGMIKEDILKFGYSASGPYQLYAKSEVTYTDGETRIIDGYSNQLVLPSLGLPLLFYAMGAPFGDKAKTEFNVPIWILDAPLWIKRLYLAGLFGAELSKPSNPKAEKYRFRNPLLSMNKVDMLKSNGYKFLKDISCLLKEFGVDVVGISEHKGVITKKWQRTIKLRLKISAKKPNLLTLWSKIGYEYCKERSILASYASQYIAFEQISLKKEAQLIGKPESELFVTGHKFRSNDNIMPFYKFIDKFKLNPPTPVIWDTVDTKDEIKNYKGYVYDFTVGHKDHNFIAEGFVTGNCGSRGFGHQLATDYLKVFDHAMKNYNISVPDRELSCAPFQSKEGQDYYQAMKCAGNMAYANRQVILHQIREGFKKVFKEDPEKLGMELIYDCTHNLAREHKIKIDGKMKKVLVHLKGATTSVGPGYERLTKPYKDLGSPIIIGGSMETGSYLLLGTKKAEEETFGTTSHGAGRRMSRSKAKKSIRGEVLQKQMDKKGIYVRGVSMSGLAEEAGFAYKEIDEVIGAVTQAGISKPIIKLKPIGNVKG